MTAGWELNMNGSSRSTALASAAKSGSEIVRGAGNSKLKGKAGENPRYEEIPPRSSDTL